MFSVFMKCNCSCTVLVTDSLSTSIDISISIDIDSSRWIIDFSVDILLSWIYLVSITVWWRSDIVLTWQKLHLLGGYLVIFAPITAKDLSVVRRDGQSARGALHVPNSERPVAWKQRDAAEIYPACPVRPQATPATSEQLHCPAL